MLDLYNLHNLYNIPGALQSSSVLGCKPCLMREKGSTARSGARANCSLHNLGTACLVECCRHVKRLVRLEPIPRRDLSGTRTGGCLILEDLLEILAESNFPITVPRMASRVWQAWKGWKTTSKELVARMLSMRPLAIGSVHVFKKKRENC